ncbi:hypothetical protein [Amycolatopsis sp. FDAARGOS 1241]
MAGDEGDRAGLDDPFADLLYLPYTAESDRKIVAAVGALAQARG